MKAVLMILSIVAMSLSAVHHFRAESNFKCELCINAMYLLKTADLQAVEDKLASKFEGMKPLMDILRARLEEFQQDGLDAEQECAKLNWCDRANLRRVDEVIDLEGIATHVNNSKYGWTADSSAFKGITREDAKQLLGAIVDPMFVDKLPLKKYEAVEDLPASFDARQQWPNCKSLQTIRDQSNCGSCWAFGTTEAFNDRSCIADYKGNGPSLPLFSTADTVGCCSFLNCFSMGCNGGQIGTPWKFFHSTGVVSGGMFGDKKDCYAQTMPECAHHVKSATLEDCGEVARVQPTCKKSCDNGADYASDKHKSTGSSQSLSSFEDVKADLVKQGSVTGAFTVYEDFLTYKSGVQEHKTGSQLGGHAIKVIGYGNEDGKDYYLVANSWNDTWGDNGTFKIVTDEISQFAAAHVN